MTWELFAAAAFVLVLAAAAVWLAGNRQMRRILGEFDAEHPEPEPEPSWSESVGYDPAEVLATIRRQAADEAWQERMVADLTGPDPLPLLADLVARQPLAIEPAPQRELEGATQ